MAEALSPARNLPRIVPAITVRLFAGPREAVGRREVRVDLHPDDTTVERALDALVAAHPALARWRSSALVSVNRSFASPSDRVRDGDELAFMPPVSGGASAHVRGDARVWDGPLSVDDALASMTRAGAGAAVAFLGIARAPAERLEFDAYREMADQEIARVRDAAVAKFGAIDALVRHRVGTLATGEDIVLVVVTAAHRREAFEAAAWIMDELKAVVPIWKKEVGPEGARWVNDPESG